MRSRWLLVIPFLVAPGCEDKSTKQTTGGATYPAKETNAAGAGQGLGAADAPFVRGSIAMVGEWKEARLAAGFAGQGADGRPHSNMSGTTFTPDSASWVESTTFQPQITRLESHEGGRLEFRHTHMPPGDYVVYVKRGGVPAAWKYVTVKPGDQLTVDLTVDTAKVGDVTATIPEAESEEPIRWPLVLIPAEIDLPGTAWHDAFQVADVKPGEPTASATGVPAGKYRAVRGKSSAEVEIVAGQKATVTLVREEPKKK